MEKHGATCDLTQYWVILAGMENIREGIPSVRRFREDETEVECCMFGMIEMRGGQTDRVFGFVSSFWATFMYKVFSSELRVKRYDFLKFLLISGI